jgi:hypothetical protein
MDLIHTPRPLTLPATSIVIAIEVEKYVEIITALYEQAPCSKSLKNFLGRQHLLVFRAKANYYHFEYHHETSHL